MISLCRNSVVMNLKVGTLYQKTTIAQGLHTTDASAGYDAACKRVLSEKTILTRIMKSCLVEYQNCDVSEIAEKYIEGQPQVSAVLVLPDEENTLINGMDTTDKAVHEGTITYDIRFCAIAPTSGEPVRLIINMGAQNLWKAFHKFCAPILIISLTGSPEVGAIAQKRIS